MGKAKDIWDILDIRSDLAKGIKRFEEKYNDATTGDNPEEFWQAVISSGTDATV